MMDKHNEKLRIAQELGADFIFSARNEYSPSPALLVGKGANERHLPKSEFANLVGFDCVFECTGIPAVWEDSVNYVRRGGRSSSLEDVNRGQR